MKCYWVSWKNLIVQNFLFSLSRLGQGTTLQINYIYWVWLWCCTDSTSERDFILINNLCPLSESTQRKQEILNNQITYCLCKHCTYTLSIYTQHVHTTCTHCMYTLHVHTTCTHCMYTLHFHTVHVNTASKLHVHTVHYKNYRKRTIGKGLVWLTSF